MPTPKRGNLQAFLGQITSKMTDLAKKGAREVTKGMREAFTTTRESTSAANFETKRNDSGPGFKPPSQEGNGLQPIEPKPAAAPSQAAPTRSIAEEKINTQRLVSNEMAQTEKSYITNLEVLNEEAQRTKQNDPNCLLALVDKSSLKQNEKNLFKEILSNSAELLTLRQKALQQYQELATNINTNPEKTAQNIKELGDISKLSTPKYATHAILLSEASKIAQQLKKEFPDQMKAIDERMSGGLVAKGANPGPKGSTIDNIFITSVQRAPREVLLAKDLAKHMAADPEKGLKEHPNFNQMKEHVGVTEQTALNINSAVRDAETKAAETKTNVLSQSQNIKSKDPNIKAADNLDIKASNGPSPISPITKPAAKTTPTAPQADTTKVPGPKGPTNVESKKPANNSRTNIAFLDIVSALTGGLIDTKKNKATKAEKKQENSAAINKENKSMKDIIAEMKEQLPTKNNIADWEKRLANVQNKLGEIQKDNLLRKNNRTNKSETVETQVSVLELKASSLHAFLKRQANEMQKNPRQMAQGTTAAKQSDVKPPEEQKNTSGTKLR